MHEPTHIKPDQSIILGNHVACDGKASKKDGQSFLVVSHYHGDHYKHHKINETFTDKIPLIVSQGTWNILERLARVNIRNNADVMAQIFNEEKEYKTFNEETIKITLKDSKHMLGASQIQVEEENGHRYGYSGDFNSDLDEFIDVDTLVLDATNGTRPDIDNWTKDNAITKLKDCVIEAYNNNNNVAIVGSAGLLQTSMHYLNDFLNEIDNLLTYEYDKDSRKSEIKTLTEIYGENNYHLPSNLKSYQEEMQNDPGFRFEIQGKKKVIVGHDLKHISDGGMNSTPERFDGVIFHIKNFCRTNDSPIFQHSKNKNMNTVSLSSHAIGDEILEYVRNVNPKLVITDSSRKEKSSVHLAEKITKELKIKAIPSSEINNIN